MRARRRRQDDQAAWLAVAEAPSRRSVNHPTATVPKPLADLLYRALRLTADDRGERVPVYVREALELYERELGRRG